MIWIFLADRRTGENKRISQVPPFGVRRQSAAAMALWLILLGPSIPKRCRASLATALHISGQIGWWSKIAKKFTVSLPISLPGGGGVAGFGWTGLDWVGLGWTGRTGKTSRTGRTLRQKAFGA